MGFSIASISDLKTKKAGDWIDVFDESTYLGSVKADKVKNQDQLESEVLLLRRVHSKYKDFECVDVFCRGKKFYVKAEHMQFTIYCCLCNERVATFYSLVKII